MASPTHSLMSIDKFNGSNFHTWQIKIKCHLMKEGLWDVVHRAAPEDSDIEQVITYVSTAKNDKAYAIILLGLGDDYIHHISDIQSASRAWITLDTLFGPRSKNSKIALMISFFDLHMQVGATIASHVNYLRSLMVQLASVKSPISEDIAIAVLLKSLPNTYDTLVTTFKYHNDPTLEGIINALREEERT